MDIKNKIVVLLNEGEIGKDLFEVLNADFGVINSNTEVETLKILNSKNPNVFLLNIKSFKYGTAMVDVIRSNIKFSAIPIIVICDDLKDKNEWLELGVIDCLEKNVNKEELLLKIRNIISLQTKYLEIKDQNDLLRVTSLIDNETGLFNKKYLSTRLVGEVSRASRQTECLSFLIIDIDDFNVLQDTYGCDAKNFVLRQATVMVKQVVRLSDIVVRYADSKIGILCPITDRIGLEILVEKLRKIIIRNTFDYENIKIKTSVSLGAYTLGTADYNGMDKKINNLLAYAEEALQRAKLNETKIEYFD